MLKQKSVVPVLMRGKSGDGARNTPPTIAAGRTAQLAPTVFCPSARLEQCLRKLSPAGTAQ